MKLFITLLLLFFSTLSLISQLINFSNRIRLLNKDLQQLPILQKQHSYEQTYYRRQIFPWKSYQSLSESQNALQAIFKNALTFKITYGSQKPHIDRPNVILYPFTLTGFFLYQDCETFLETLCALKIPIRIETFRMQRNGFNNYGLQYSLEGTLSAPDKKFSEEAASDVIVP